MVCGLAVALGKNRFNARFTALVRLSRYAFRSNGSGCASTSMGREGMRSFVGEAGAWRKPDSAQIFSIALVSPITIFPVPLKNDWRIIERRTL
jgi:hypothetical protein